MTRTFCDRCGKEITLENYFHFVQRYADVNRSDLGLSQMRPAPLRILLCSGCDRAVELFLCTKPHE